MADQLAETWRTGAVKVDQAPPIVLKPVPEMGAEEQEASSESHEESGAPAAKIPAGPEGLSTWWSSSPERYLDWEFRDLSRSSQTSPISPSTPMCAVYVGRAAEKGKTRLAIPPQHCREMGRRWWLGPAILVGRSRPTRRAVRISKGTSDPDNLGSDKATSLVGKFLIVHFRFFFPKPGPSPQGPICFPIPGDCHEKRGSGEEEDPRGEERTDRLPATVMSLTCRASYFYSGWLCIALSCAILSGHGY